ncbi:hypothetical protein [Lysinibacillus fusiformis]|uniref:hypothetical protein n=1 Tax=Lysinibacillus fusiformis TaxID=28031 RepID=UPI00263A64E4|nr:hypothetical protein [Lysinibacillus fusiformis]MDC6267300.1 hypothetical protein [Lysinibacillus sphaericus]MDN4968266.1 hypothetical protein [Lysinibacillus fusiformis]MDN4968440.1 hypothetical protein [Lysinibacillus fusiformis]
MESSGLDAIKGMSSLNVLRRVRKMLHYEYDLMKELHDADSKGKQEMMIRVLKEFSKIENEYL